MGAFLVFVVSTAFIALTLYALAAVINEYFGSSK